MPADVLPILLVAAGGVTLLLGLTHFYYPALFSYRLIFDSYPQKDRTLKPFKLGMLRYPMDVDKAYGIVWMMNHHVSLVLVSIGVLEVYAPAWLLAEGKYLALWIAGWWL